MTCIGPLEIVRSPSWETWRLTWNRPDEARRGVWMYRWAICTPWITLRWLSSEFRRSLCIKNRSARAAPSSREGGDEG